MIDFIAKPFRLPEILEKIRAHLGVGYVYRKPSAVVLTATDSLGGGPTNETLAGLPAGLREAMRQASLSGDIFLLKDLIEGIAVEQPCAAITVAPASRAGTSLSRPPTD